MMEREMIRRLREHRDDAQRFLALLKTDPSIADDSKILGNMREILGDLDAMLVRMERRYN